MRSRRPICNKRALAGAVARPTSQTHKWSNRSSGPLFINRTSHHRDLSSSSRGNVPEGLCALLTYLQQTQQQTPKDETVVRHSSIVVHQSCKGNDEPLAVRDASLGSRART